MRQTRFDWIALKTRKKAVPNKNRPGLKQEHTEALLENENISLLQLIEQEKQLNTEG
jgi:hypothetical protein